MAMACPWAFGQQTLRIDALTVGRQPQPDRDQAV